MMRSHPTTTTHQQTMAPGVGIEPTLADLEAAVQNHSHLPGIYSTMLLVRQTGTPPVSSTYQVEVLVLDDWRMKLCLRVRRT